MTTLAKPKRRNKRMATPLSERLFPTMRENFWTPWNQRFFAPHLSKLDEMTDMRDFFNGDFFEEDSLMPAMNIKEHDRNFEIELAAPGFSKEDFKISIEEDILRISGEQQGKEEEKEDEYTRQEFRYRTFERSLALPETIDFDQELKATYKDGILKLNLLKKEVTKPTPKKVIEVI
jgi:HSP20 family protein